jgi:hypothetical protein
MGERAVIDEGLETLEDIGKSESTTFVLPQELTSLMGRYGKHLTGSDVAPDGAALESLDFDADTRELIGLDRINDILEELDIDASTPEPAEEGAEPAPEIRSAEGVIEEVAVDGEEPDA